MQTLQPYLSPLDVIKTDIMDIVDIPSHAISLVLDIGGTAWDIVMGRVEFPTVRDSAFQHSRYHA